MQDDKYRGISGRINDEVPLYTDESFRTDISSSIFVNIEWIECSGVRSCGDTCVRACVRACAGVRVCEQTAGISFKHIRFIIVTFIGFCLHFTSTVC